MSAQSRWRDVVRESLLVVCSGMAIGLVSNGVRSDGLDLGTAPARAIEGECAPPTEQTNWVSLAEAIELVRQPDVVFVDARPHDEFVQAHVAGAYSVPFHAGERVPKDAIDAVAGARVVVTYCDTHGGCQASSELAKALAQAGARDVRVLEGGWPAWHDAGAPAEAGACRLCPER